MSGQGGGSTAWSARYQGSAAGAGAAADEAGAGAAVEAGAGATADAPGKRATHYCDVLRRQQEAAAGAAAERKRAAEQHKGEADEAAALRAATSTMRAKMDLVAKMEAVCAECKMAVGQHSTTELLLQGERAELEEARDELRQLHSAWHDTSEVVVQFGMTQYFAGSDLGGARVDKARGAAQCMLTNRARRCPACKQTGKALPSRPALRRHRVFDLLHPVVLGLWQQRSGRPLGEHSGDKSSAHKVRMVWKLIDQTVLEQAAAAKAASVWRTAKLDEQQGHCDLTKLRLCVALRLTADDKRVTRFRRFITLVSMVVFAVAYTVHSLHWVNDGSLYRVKQRVRDTVCGLKNVQRSVVGGGGAPAAATNGYFDNSTMPLTVGDMMDVEAAVHTGLDICPWVRNAFVPSMYAGHFNSQGGNNASLWRSGYVLDASVMVAGAMRVSQVRARVPGGRWWGAL
jgi:hypothetical protein